MATVMIKRLASSPFVFITVLFTLAAFSFSSRFPFKPINTSLQQQGQIILLEGFSLRFSCRSVMPLSFYIAIRCFFHAAILTYKIQYTVISK